MRSTSPVASSPATLRTPETRPRPLPVARMDVRAGPGGARIRAARASGATGAAHGLAVRATCLPRRLWQHDGVHASIAAKKELVGEICRRRHVRKLEIFGSATRPDFDPERSDVDLIAHFDPREDLLDAYFGLKAELEALFGRPVDLLTARPVRNPYLRESIEQSRQALYAA